MFEGIPVIGPLLEQLETMIPVQDLIDQGYNFISNLSFAEQAIGLLVAAIVIVLGVFDLIKKLSKLIIVVAILVGLWLLYNNGALDGLIGG